MSRLVNDLMYHGYLRADAVIDAMNAISREEFVLSKFRKQADADLPLPIGHGQTISSPKVVAIMLELLDPKKGQTMLDAGTGSGWTAALLASIAGETGKVVTIERLEDLYRFGKENIEKYGFISKGIVECVLGDAGDGYEKEAPYDRILVSAMASKVPDALKKQLKIGGKLVIPIYNNVCYFEKRGEDDFYKEEFGGFSFVPFVQRSSF